MVLSRLTVFSVDGDVLSETRLPGGFLPVQVSDDGIVGSLLEGPGGSESTRGSSVFPPPRHALLTYGHLGSALPVVHGTPAASRRSSSAGRSVSINCCRSGYMALNASLAMS